MSRHVLVVDDEPAICAVVADVLEPRGFSTDCSRSADEAYAVLGLGRPFACMIVDVNLGRGHTGFDVARFARKLDPDLPIIYVTGQASAESLRTHGVPGSLYVAKPFTPEELMAQITKLVGDKEN